MVKISMRGPRGKAHRRRQRQRIGRLHDRVLSTRTLNRYLAACKRVFRFCGRAGVVAAATPAEADRLLCQYIEAAWQEGDSKGWADDAISGLAHFAPAARAALWGATANESLGKVRTARPCATLAS